jgi:hypothetical protein
MCSNLCDYKQNFKHKKFMCIHCTCPFVSLILIASKSISDQGRKMNMNSDLSWHRCVKHNLMHILMLIFYRKYVILVSCRKPQNLIFKQHWFKPSCVQMKLLLALYQWAWLGGANNLSGQVCYGVSKEKKNGCP